MQPRIRRATDADARAVADVLIRSFKTTYPTFREVHTDDEIGIWTTTTVIPTQEVWIAMPPDTARCRRGTSLGVAGPI